MTADKRARPRAAPVRRAAPPGPEARRLSGTVERREHATVIRLRGTLHAGTAACLRELVLAAMAGRAQRVVLDVTGVVVDDELGLWVLPAMAGCAAQNGVAFTAVVPSRELRVRLGGLGVRVLEITDAMPDLSTPRPHEWRVEELFAIYSRAVLAGDVELAARCHTEPTYVVDDAVVHTLDSRREVETSLAELASVYRAIGLVRARLRVETASVLDERHCRATVRWCHGGDGDTPVVTARYRYLLRRARIGDVVNGLPDVRINTVSLLEAPHGTG